MKIRALSLENFRSHVRTELRLGDGIIAIIGENGAGKTSILEAVAYALFPDLFRGKTDSLIRDGADYMRVSLEFEVNGKVYRVTRERPRNGQPTAIIEAPDSRRILQRGQRNVNKQILEILGMSPEVLINAVYVRQGEIADLIMESPTERRKLIAKLMKVDQLERLWDDLGSAISHFRSELAGLQGELTVLQRIERELIDLRKRRDLLRVKKEELSDKLEDVVKKMSELEAELKEIQRKQEIYMKIRSEVDKKEGEASHLRDKIERLSKELTGIETKIKSYREEVGSLGNLDLAMEAYRIYVEVEGVSSQVQVVKEWMRRVDRIRKELDSIKVDEGSLEAYKRLEEDISSTQSSIASIREEIGHIRSKLLERKRRVIELESEVGRKLSELSAQAGFSVESLNDLNRVKEIVRELEEVIRSLEEKRDLLLREHSALEAKAKEYRRSLESLKEARGRCPVCGSELTEERRLSLINELRENIANVESRVYKLNSELKAIENSIRERRERLEVLRSFDLDSLRELISSVPSLKREVEELEMELRSKKSQLRELEKKLSGLVKDRKRLESELRALERKKYLEEQLIREQEKGKSLPDLNTLEDRLQNLRTKLSSLAGQLGVEVEKVSSIGAKLSRVRRILEELDRLTGRKSAVEEEIQDLKEKLHSVELELSKLRSNMLSIGYSKEEHSSLEEEYKGLNLIKSKLERELGSLEGELRALEKDIASREDEVRKLKELRDKARSLEEFIGVLEQVRHLFHREKGIQRFIRERARPFIEEKASEIFSSFGFQYDSLEIDEDYTPHLIRGALKYGMDKMSGGELIAAALSLRLALANFLVTSEVESFFLDEPTIHLDESRVDSLVDSLTHMEVPQLIVVTHSDKFMNVADQTILVRKERGISRVEVIQTSSEGYP